VKKGEALICRNTRLRCRNWGHEHGKEGKKRYGRFQKRKKNGWGGRTNTSNMSALSQVISKLIEENKGKDMGSIIKRIKNVNILKRKRM